MAFDFSRLTASPGAAPPVGVDQFDFSQLIMPTPQEASASGPAPQMPSGGFGSGTLSRMAEYQGLSPEQAASKYRSDQWNALSGLYNTVTDPSKLASAAGGLISGAANAVIHPIDTAEKIAQHYYQNPDQLATDAAFMAAPLGPVKAVAEAAPAVPRLATIADLKKLGGAGIDVAQHSGITLSPEYSSIVRNNFTDVLTQGGYDAQSGLTGQAALTRIVEKNKLAPSPFSALREPLTFEQLVKMSKDLNSVLRDTRSQGSGSVVHGTAGRLKEMLDAQIGAIAQGMYKDGDLVAVNMSPEEAARGFQLSNATYAAGKRAEALQQAIDLAEASRSQFTQSGVANAIKREARKQVTNYIKGNPHKISAQDFQTYKQLANPEGFSEAMLLELRRHLSGAIGTGISATVGATLGGPIGAAAGAAGTYLVGRGVREAQDALALAHATNFLNAIRAQGSAHLRDLMGGAVHDHLMAAPKGREAVSNWTNSIGTKKLALASRALALYAANAVKRPELTPRIYDELMQLGNQVQGSSPSEAQPQQNP